MSEQGNSDFAVEMPEAEAVRADAEQFAVAIPPEVLPCVTADQCTIIAASIKALEAVRERIKEQAAAMIAKVERAEDFLHRLYDAPLAEFVRQHAAGKSRYVDLLGAGRLALRRTPDRVDVTDEDAYMAWAKEADPAGATFWRQLVVEAPCKRQLSDYVKTTSEIPPGTVLVPGADSLTIK